MRKLSVLSLFLHTTGSFFPRTLSIIILTFDTLMRVSDEIAFSTQLGIYLVGLFPSLF